MKKVIPLLFFSWLAPCAVGQQPYSDKDAGKWEVGFDFLPMIDSVFHLVPARWVVINYRRTEGYKGTTLLIRYKLLPQFKSRVRIGLKYRKQTITPPAEFLITTTSEKVITDKGAILAVGMEKHFTYQRVSLFLGAEGFGLLFSSRHFEEHTAIVPERHTIIDNWYTVKSFGFNALAGADIQVAKGFALQVEGKLEFSSRSEILRHDRTEKGFYAEQAGINFENRALEFKPIAAVRLVYRF